MARHEIEYSSNVWEPNSPHVNATMGNLSVKIWGRGLRIVTPARNEAEFLMLKPGTFGSWKVGHKGTRAECMAVAMTQV
jgi:hypothetical protein